MPAEPPPTQWRFPPVDSANEHGLVGVGADLEPGTLLAAYRSGLFPMPVDHARRIGWWSPDPRGIIPLDGLRVTRSLRRSLDRYEIRIDTSFDEVIGACCEPEREGAWITTSIRHAYVRLHELGWAHSVEAFTTDGGMAGGLYGVSIGGLFAGESMFHRERDASKVALVALVERLRAAGAVLLDVQWTTDHLVSLGAVDVSRGEYMRRLAGAIALDVDPWGGGLSR